MGLPLARINDLCTGHGCFPPRPTLPGLGAGGSENVFVNKRGLHRVGDGWLIHCCGPSCHTGATVSGSTTVFCNGVPAARISDPISCGSAIMTGSSNTSAGG